MNETLDRIIKESGEMWEAVRDRTASYNAVLVQTINQPGNMVFELTLPEGEHHPFWRIHERALEPEEIPHRNRARGEGHLHEIGNLMYADQNGLYYRVRAHIFNGRVPHKWSDSLERVRVTIEEVIRR